ncbi:glycosyltransferase family 4 protein [Micropruina sp.]|uniref:glycosyltransferase family 4 protein n=1 Tax=Micropruina sp. TaxID=2737536 RepID=UPI0039E6A0B8
MTADRGLPPETNAADPHDHGGQGGDRVPMLLVGGLFDDRQREIVERDSLGPTQAAADVLQWGFVRGLESIPEVCLTIGTAPFVGSYPKRFRRPWIESRPFEHGDAGRNRQIGFLNLPLVKHFSRAAALSRFGRRWARHQPADGVALGYSLSLEIVWALAAIKRANPLLKVGVIVPDLPEFMNTQEKPRLDYRILKAVESRLVRHLMSALDAGVLLTESMARKLPPKPHVVIEGIAPPPVDTAPSWAGVSDADRQALSGRKVVVYAGTTNVRYGVIELCRAFRAVPGDDLALVVCGAGDGAEQIAEHAALDPRIRYLGQLPRSTVLTLENSATILVNPRSSKEEFSAYSFPSKILEYMSTGVPVLCYRLGGIPAEYDSYLTYVSGDSVDDFAACLREMLGSPPGELAAKGQVAKEFVEAEKSAAVQARKIVAFLTRSRPGARAVRGLRRVDA